MIWLSALTVAALAGIGLWMLLDGNLRRVVLGIAVLGNAINLAVLAAGRLGSESAAFTPGGVVPAGAANPLPQALVLTAIVIGFALFAFVLAVLKRSRELHGEREIDRISARTEAQAPDLRQGPAADEEPRA